MAFVGLPGVAAESIDGPNVKSVTGALEAMKAERMCWFAGDYGSINVWRDDDGKLRANFCRYQAVLDEEIFTTKKALQDWLRAWTPKLHTMD